MTELLGSAGAGEGLRPSPVAPLSEQILRRLVEAVARGALRPGW